jgi:hypothetical protein
VKTKILLTSLLALGLMPALSQTPFNTGLTEDTNILNQIPTDKSWESQTEHKQWAEQQKAIDDTQAEGETLISSIKNDISLKSLAATNSETEYETLRKHILDLKKIVPRDPWREIYGETKYVNSPRSGFVKFNGQILEVAQDGIRVLGQIGETKENVEYFVINFPYPFKAGESVDPTKVYTALQDGEFSFITEDGYAKKILKLNYGKPCIRPANAATVELTALRLNSEDESQMSSLELKAKEDLESVTAAQQLLKKTQGDFASIRKSAVEKLTSDKENTLRATLEKADKNEPTALRRMGERYRDGDGVEQNTRTAYGYYQKAEKALQAAVDNENEEAKLKQEEFLKAKLLQNINLADKNDNVYSMLYLSRCYSNGIGTGKDFVKAKEYYDKAVSTGLPKRPNEALY